MSNIKLKNLLAENMRRFGTMNLNEDTETLQDSAYSLGYHLSSKLADLIDDNEDKLQLIVDNFNLALEESLTDSLGINVKASVIMDEGYDNYMDDFHESKKKNQKNKKLTSADIKSKIDSLKAKDEDPTKKGVQGLGKRDL